MGLSLSAASIPSFGNPIAQNGSKQRLEFAQAHSHSVHSTQSRWFVTESVKPLPLSWQAQIFPLPAWQDGLPSFLCKPKIQRNIHSAARAVPPALEDAPKFSFLPAASALVSDWPTLTSMEKPERCASLQLQCHLMPWNRPLQLFWHPRNYTPLLFTHLSSGKHPPW